MARKKLTEAEIYQIESEISVASIPYVYDTKEYPVEVIVQKYNKGQIFVPMYQRNFYGGLLMSKKTNYVIPHTHWDREWYQTFQNYRYRLVRMMDNLIEGLEKDEEYKEFYKHLSHDFEDPLTWAHNRVEGELEYTRTIAGAGRGAARVRIKVKEHGGTPQNTYTMYVCPACKIGFHFKDTLPPLPKPQKDYSKMTVREFKRINNCL